MAKNSPNLGKETEMQVLEVQNITNKINPNRDTSRNIITKMSKVKERIFQAAREKQIAMYKGNPIRLPADFSAETEEEPK